jgi:hypothetical protein
MLASSGALSTGWRCRQRRHFVVGQYSGSIELYPKNMSSPAIYERIKRFIALTTEHRGV